jgi:nucleoside diphosphate-linked moiety X motif protein 19
MSNPASKIRTAATLMTCVRVKESTQRTFDYNVLLLKRSKNMKFASSNYVFPGGKFDSSDVSLKWLDVFFKNENRNEYFKNLIFKNINRPNVFSSSERGDLNSQKLPLEISYRLCAIRETFEETGLLIAHKNDGIETKTNERKKFASFILDKDLIKWLRRIREKSDEFINMFLENNICPDIFALHDWSSWLTPVQEKSRFDTIFFSCFLNEFPIVNNFEVNLDESSKLEVG